MALPLILTSLAEKRARLEAEREHHQKRADKALADIAKIDATMALWENGQYVRSERRSYRENPGPFKWRELPRMVIDILRESPEPLSTYAVQAAVCARKGIALSTAAERAQLSRRVTGAINDKRRQGHVVSDGMLMGRHLWRLAKDGEADAQPHREKHAQALREKRTRERMERGMKHAKIARGL